MSKTGIVKFLARGGVDEPLPHGWEKPLADNGRDIVAKLVEAWDSERQFDAILIGGGGTEVPAIVDAIRSRFNQRRLFHMARSPSCSATHGWHSDHHTHDPE